MLDRVEHGLETPVHVQLAEDVAEMRLHGSFADEERLRDVSVRSARGENPQDLVLTRRQAFI